VNCPMIPARGADLPGGCTAEQQRLPLGFKTFRVHFFAYCAEIWPTSLAQSMSIAS